MYGQMTERHDGTNGRFFAIFRTGLKTAVINTVKRAISIAQTTYEGWNFNSGDYLFITDTK